MRNRRWGLTLCTMAALLSGCGGEDTPAEVAAAAPTQEAFVEALQSLHKALKAGDYEGAADYFVIPGTPDAEDIERALTRTLKDELSEDGIFLLIDDGKFGPLKELHPSAGPRWATRSGVDLEACFSLALKPAEVAAHWNGQRFRFIRLDEVRRIK